MYRRDLKFGQIIVAVVLTVTLGLAGLGFAAKGGGGGKPPKDPPLPPPLFDPVIVYIDSNSIIATDAEGLNQLPVLESVRAKGRVKVRTRYSSPAWSPDGNHVVFTGSGPELATGLYSIELIRDSDGMWTGETSERQLIFEGSVFSPAWHPNRQQIAFAAEPTGTLVSDIFLINVDGTGLINLTNTPDFNDYYLTWSPDGNRLASTESFWMNANFQDVVVYDIVYDLDGEARIEKKTILHRQEFGSINGISWSKSKVAEQPDLIAFSAPSASSGGTNSFIWCIPVDDPTQQPQMLTTNVDEDTVSPSWSSDDSQLVTRQSNGLVVFDLDYPANPNGCPTDSDEHRIVESGAVPKWRR